MIAQYNFLLDNWGSGMTQWWERLPSTDVSRGRFRPSAKCGLSLLLVLDLLRGFFSGFFAFPPSTKTSTPIQFNSKFQIDQVRGPAWKPCKAYMASSLLSFVIYSPPRLTLLCNLSQSKYSVNFLLIYTAESDISLFFVMTGRIFSRLCLKMGCWSRSTLLLKSENMPRFHWWKNQRRWPSD